MTDKSDTLIGSKRKKSSFDSPIGKSKKIAAKIEPEPNIETIKKKGEKLKHENKGKIEISGKENILNKTTEKKIHSGSAFKFGNPSSHLSPSGPSGPKAKFRLSGTSKFGHN